MIIVIKFFSILITMLLLGFIFSPALLLYWAIIRKNFVREQPIGKLAEWIDNAYEITFIVWIVISLFASGFITFLIV